jgi:hypothetical protein
MTVNAPAAPADLSWLWSTLGHLLEVLGLGGLGLAWRGESRITKLEAARDALADKAAALKERADAHDVDRAAIAETLAGIRESVARLPTRDELERVRQDLKQDYRASRPDL